MDYSKEITDQFLVNYRKLEKVKKDNNTMYDYYENNNKNLFEIFRSIRNNLTHNEVDGSYPVIVSNIVNDKLVLILKEMNIKANDIAVKKKDVFTAIKSDYLKDIVEVMSKNNYSYVPILDDNDKICGVISEMAIFDIISSNNGAAYTSDTKVAEYFNFFQIENENEMYFFIKKDTLLFEIKNIYEKRYKNGKKIGAIFITSSGMKDGRFEGLITARNAY